MGRCEGGDLQQGAARGSQAALHDIHGGLHGGGALRGGAGAVVLEGRQPHEHYGAGPQLVQEVLVPRLDALPQVVQQVHPQDLRAGGCRCWESLWRSHRSRGGEDARVTSPAMLAAPS